MEDSNEAKVKQLPTNEQIGRFGLLTPAVALVPKIEGRDAVSQSFTEFHDSNRNITLAAAHINDAITGRGRYGMARYYFKPRYAQIAFKIIINMWFQRLLYVVIIVHSGLVFIEPPSVKPSDELTLAAVAMNFVCLCLYAFDITLVMAYVSWKIFLRSEEYYWNRVELLFSILFFLDWILLTVQVSLKNPDVVQPFRCLRLAMLVCKVKNIGHIYSVVWSIFIKLGRATLIGFVFILLFSAIGIHLLMPMYQNIDCSSPCLQQSNFCQLSMNGTIAFNKAFDHVIFASVQLFILLTTENYPDFIFPAYCNSKFTFFYFGSFLFFGVFILTALLIAVIANIYWESYKVTKIIMHSFITKEYNKIQVKKERSMQRTELIKAWNILDVLGEEKLSVNNPNLLLLFKKLKPRNTDEENLELIHALDNENEGHITWLTWVTTLLHVLEYEKVLTFQSEVITSASPSWWLSMKALALRILKLKYFETTILVLIIIHCILFPLKWNDITFLMELLIQAFKSVIVTIFMVEMLLRLTAYGHNMLVKPFELTDFVLVFVGFSANLTWYFKFNSNLSHKELLKGISVVVSSLAIFSRLFLNSSQTRQAMILFLHLIPIMLDLIALFAILMYLYAVVGMEAFHDVEMGEFVLTYGAYDCNLGFQDFKCSLLVIFQIITTNNWQEVMNSVIERTRYPAAIYFISCYIIVNLIFMNLLVAIGIEAFNKLKSEEKGKEKVEAGSSPKTSRQEDEVSTVSKLPSVQNLPQKNQLQLLTRIKSAASFALGTTRSDYHATIPNDWTMPSPSRNSFVITSSNPNRLGTNRLSRLPQHVSSKSSSSEVMNVIQVQGVRTHQPQYACNPVIDKNNADDSVGDPEQQKCRKIKERLQQRKHLKDHITMAKVVAAFKGTKSDHLNLKEGEEVKVLSEEPGWIHAKSHSGKVGWIPDANVLKIIPHKSNKINPAICNSDEDVDDSSDSHPQSHNELQSSNTWTSFKKRADSLKPNAEAHLDQKKFYKGYLNSNWNSHIQDVTVMNKDEFQKLRQQLASSPVPQRKHTVSSVKRKKPKTQEIHLKTSVLTEDECYDDNSTRKTKTLLTGTVNYPEVVQDNTESPTEDETALTEVFETSVRKMDREQRNKSQLPQAPIQISVQECDDISDVLNSPDSEPHSGRQSLTSTVESLQVPVTSQRRAQSKFAPSKKSDQEIPEWAKNLAAEYNKPIEQVNFDSQI